MASLRYDDNLDLTHSPRAFLTSPQDVKKRGASRKAAEEAGEQAKAELQGKVTTALNEQEAHA